MTASDLVLLTVIILHEEGIFAKVVRSIHKECSNSENDGGKKLDPQGKLINKIFYSNS